MLALTKFLGADNKQSNQIVVSQDNKTIPTTPFKGSNAVVKKKNNSYNNQVSSGGGIIVQSKSVSFGKSSSNDSLLNLVKSIEQKVIKIDSVLKESFAFQKNEESKRKKEEEKGRYSKKENRLKDKKPPSGSKGFKMMGLQTPQFGVFDFIKRFIFWNFMNWLYKNIIPFLPAIGNVVGQISKAVPTILEFFGGVANVLTTFVSGGIRLVNGLTKTLAIVSGARSEEDIQKFTQKFNMMMDLALLAAMLAGDAGFNVLDLLKKGKGKDKIKDAAGRAAQKTGGIFRRGTGRAIQRTAIKVAGKRGGNFVKGVTKGVKGLANKATGGVFARGGGRALTRIGIKVAGKGGGKLVSGAGKVLGKAAGPIALIATAATDFMGRKASGQNNLQAGAGTAAGVGGAWAGAKGGAAIGAAIGSIFPGPGTLIGGILGGVIGAAGGAWAAGKIADKVTGADKVSQPQTPAIPGNYRGGIVRKYELGGNVEEIKDEKINPPRRGKVQDTVEGKDVGGPAKINILFPTSGKDESGNKKPENQSKSWWASIFGGGDDGSSTSQNQKSNEQSSGLALDSLKETSKTLKKIPFVGELMGISVDIAMGQKPDKPSYNRLAEKIVYIGQSLSNTKSIADLSDRAKEVQKFTSGGIPTTQSAIGSISEKSTEELRNVVALSIEKGSNDAITDIRKKIMDLEFNLKPPGSGGDNAPKGGAPEGGGDAPAGGGGGGAPAPAPAPDPAGGGGGGAPTGGGSTDSFAISMIKIHEGSNIVGGRHKAYKDSKGYWTIGYGHLIKPGDGYNSSSVISQDEADKLFKKDYDYHKKAAMKIPGYASASPQQQAALIDLTFNMGASWYQGFPKFTEAFSKKDYTSAQSQLRNSAWYGQVGRRAEPIISLIGNKGIPRSAGYLSGISVPSSSTQAQTSTPSGGGRPPTAQRGGGGTRPSTSSAGKVFHPETGGGYSGGQTDQQGRPIVLSKYAADAFRKMVQDSGMNLGASVASSGRSESKNRSVGGDSNSHHMYGEALDMNGAGFEWVKKHGQKYGWRYGYNHGPGSAHFKYVGSGAGVPPKLAQSQKELQGYAFHGGLIVKEGVYKLHDGEFIIDKDTVNLLGTDFFQSLNSVENKITLEKIGPTLAERISESVSGGAFVVSKDYRNSNFSKSDAVDSSTSSLNNTTKKIDEFNKQQETKTEESQQKENGLDDNKKQRVQVASASHPQTGSGFAIKGVTDGNGRPLILSKGGITAFGEMMKDSKGAVKGSDVASGKRSEAHNRKVGGVPNSNHLGGNALDIHGSSQTWMRRKGAAYGWVINDYPGSHGGHFDYKGKNADDSGDTFAARSADTVDDSVTDFSPSGGGGGGGSPSGGGGGGSPSGGGRGGGGSPQAGRDEMLQRNMRQVDVEPTEPLVPGAPRPNGGKFKPDAPMAGGAVKTDDKIFKELGASNEDWDIFRNTIAHIESKGAYDIAGGSGGRYDGRYQMGAAAKKDAAKILGIPNPGHNSDARAAYRSNPELQEKMFAAYTMANHRYLMGNKDYQNASVERKLQILGYAHNQGMGGAEKWLRTGKVGADGFGTKGTAYTDALAANFKARQRAINDGTYGRDNENRPRGSENKPGSGSPGDVEKDQQIAGNTKGKYGRLGYPNTDDQDTGADIELFGTRGEIPKTFGDNSKQGPYGNRGVEISFPYDLIYMEKVPGGRNKGAKSVMTQGSTSRDYKVVTGSTGFGHVGSYYYKDPNTGKMFEVMMGHGNKPFKKFNEGEVIKAGTVVGWQGATGSSDSDQGGVYDHVTFHVNAVDGGDPGPVFNKFVDALVTGKGAQLTARQREEAKKQENLIASDPKQLLANTNDKIKSDLEKKDIIIKNGRLYKKGGGIFGTDLELKVDRNTNSWIFKKLIGADNSPNEPQSKVKVNERSERTGGVQGGSPSRSRGDFDLIIPLDHVKPENINSIPDTKGGSTFENARATGAAGRERDHQDSAASELKKRLERMGYRVKVITPEEFGNYADYDKYLEKNAARNVPIMPLHFDAAKSAGGGFLTRIKNGDLDDAKFAKPIQNALSMFYKGNENLGRLGPTDTVSNATINRSALSAATLVELGGMVDWEENYGKNFTKTERFGVLMDMLAGAVSEGIGQPKNKPNIPPTSQSQLATQNSQTKPQGTNPIESIKKTIGNIGNTVMNVLTGSTPASAATTPAKPKPSSKPNASPAKPRASAKPKRAWFDPRKWVGMQDGGLVGENLKTQPINSRSIDEFASYERDYDSPMIIFQEIEIIKESKPVEPSGGVTFAPASRKSDNSYMLRRQ